LIPQIQTLLEQADSPINTEQIANYRQQLSIQVLVEKLTNIYGYIPSMIPAMIYNLLFKHILFTELDKPLNSHSKLWLSSSNALVSDYDATFNRK
jgi:hypothetical protein